MSAASRAVACRCFSLHVSAFALRSTFEFCCLLLTSIAFQALELCAGVSSPEAVREVAQRPVASFRRFDVEQQHQQISQTSFASRDQAMGSYSALMQSADRGQALKRSPIGSAGASVGLTGGSVGMAG
eukprot:3806821-Rhodomonas_salina.1